MSIPLSHVEDLLTDLSQSHINNLVTQADARRILQEVKELSENYPDFDHELTEKATHIAYALLSCGCALVENEGSETAKGLAIIEKAGKILSDVYKYNSLELEIKDYNLLIAGMALYASKQYSRAFIILNDVDADFVVGQMVIKFIQKDFESLLLLATNAFFEKTSESFDIRNFDIWVISHEIARCFLVITDFIHTGNQQNFELANDICAKLIMLASESNLPSYWLIVRLLKIIFSTFRNASLWSVLPPLLSSKDVTEKYIRLLSGFKSPVTEMWPSQTASLPLAVGENSGAVINLRTSGGKTRVAEIAILKTLTTSLMSKVLYLAPFRSLAFELEQSLNKIFGPLNITVSQLYGGLTANVTDFELINQSRVIIATPEKAKALIRCGSDLVSGIKLIVVDEGHLLGVEERYIKNELFLTHLKEFASRNQIRMLLLSAVLPNAGDLAQWIAGDTNLVAKSEWKPALERLGLLLWNGSRVRLEWKSDNEPYNPNFIQKKPLGFSRRINPFPNNKNEAVAATAVRLAEAGTTMIYSARANSIAGLAKSVLLALGEHPEDYSWDNAVWNMFESVCIEELESDNIILRAARKGVICHNNRLPTLVRIAIERLMRSKPPLIIIASSTLGQGVNVGISTIIVSTPYYSTETISKRDFWNICGRAGRAFSDVEGKVLYAIDTTENQRKINKNRWLAHNYFDKHQMEEVHSGLLAALRAIYIYAEKTGTDFTMLVETIANDFSESNIDEDFVKKLNYIFDFLDDELLAMHEDFAEDNTSVSWIDDVFRKSLALIQAEHKDEELYIKLLRARTAALLNRVPDKTNRKRLISSGVPLALAQSILENIDNFRDLALQFIQASAEASNQIEVIDNAIHKIEIWSNKNAQSLMNGVPDQGVLDKIRTHWIGGTPLATIRALEEKANEISKDYYGFILPWIIHAISQMFNKETEGNIVKVYTELAMYVELGLPNLSATKIYMAGIRSRSAALELSAFWDFKEEGISSIKQILIDLSLQDINISDNSRAWLELLIMTGKAQMPKKVSFPIFTWDRTGLPDKLYIREAHGEYFLVSSDGYFYEKIESTNELPFSKIANIAGLFFEYQKNNEWNLGSYNPMLIVE